MTAQENPDICLIAPEALNMEKETQLYRPNSRQKIQMKYFKTVIENPKCFLS